MYNSPLVSVIVPVYRAEFLEVTLHSLCQQDYDALEIIVCDNSGDALVGTVIGKLADVAPYPIRHLHHVPALALQETLSQALRQAEGDYVKFLASGDTLREDAVGQLVAALELSPDIVLAAAHRRRIDEQGEAVAPVFGSAYPFPASQVVEGASLLRFFSDYVINFIGELSCVLCRREALLALAQPLFQLGGQPVTNLSELALYVRLLQSGHLAILKDTLVQHRVSGLEQRGAIEGATYAEEPVFARAVRQLAGEPSKEKNRQLVRIASFEQPDRFASYDLVQGCQRARDNSLNAPSNLDWLAQRVPSATEYRLIADHLARHPQGRTFMPVILDLDGQRDKLDATLDSLNDALRPVAFLAPFILTVDAALAEVYPQYCVQHVTQQTWIGTLNCIVSDYEFDWLLLLRAGERLTTGGLLTASVDLIGAQGCCAVYGDELYRNEQGALGASCRPDFNIDYLLSLPSVMCYHWLFNRHILLALGGFDSEFSDNPEFEYIVRLIEQKGSGAIGHLSEFLTVSPPLSTQTRVDDVRVLQRHLQRRGYPNGQVMAQSALPGHYRLHYGHQARPLVSIIIPTKDQLPVLAACVTSLMEKTRYNNYELLIVDNNSETPQAQSWLDGVARVDPRRIRVLRYPHPFNYSAINNLAAREAHGEYLVLLNNDTAVIQGDWLDNLLNHAQRPEVGIVGAKLLYPDGRIQHGGVVLGLRGPAEHPFPGDKNDSAGYMQRLKVDQNYTAVTGACLMIRRSIYLEVGGLDDQAFKVSYNDIDLCLKVWQLGYLTVWTPWAQVMHEGSVSQNKAGITTPEAKALRWREHDAIYEKWLPVIANDPAYNTNLSLGGRGFEIEADVKLNWRPLSWRPLPVVLAHNADSAGCGHYRVLKPFDALKNAGLIDGKISNGYLNLPLLARYAPDVLLLQRPVTERFHQWAEHVSRFTRSFKVFELDDYLPNLPLKSNARAHMPRDIIKTMRKSLGFVDRFVVSTPAMAEAFAGFHADIRVVENRLPLQWWGEVQGLKRQGGKPRVGWGGGSSHTGDLELIVDIVKALADEVEWVFLGMCPPKLRPYVHEFHSGVPIDLYPAKLASLNLDLALAPLEENLFNRCKSNLRLLEYGACGFPVICTDIEPYQGDLPVTRVRNRYKEWMEAIRMHLADLDSAARMGDALQAAIHRDWMLSGDNLEQWRKAWLPD